MSKVKTPVLGISFEKDYLAPKLSVDQLLTKFKKSKRIHVHTNAAKLGLKKISHFSWVKTPQPIVKIIIKWFHLLN